MVGCAVPRDAGFDISTALCGVVCFNATPRDVTLGPMKVLHLVSAVALLPVSVAVRGQGLESCKSIEDDIARLACYDRAAGRAGKGPPVLADQPIPED